MAWMREVMQKTADRHWLLVLTKVDLLPKAELLPIIDKTSKLMPEFHAIIPVCAKEGLSKPGSNLSEFIKVAQQLAPVGGSDLHQGPMDRSQRFPVYSKFNTRNYLSFV